MACSILESQKGELIGSNHDFNSILKVILCVVVCCVVCVFPAHEWGVCVSSTLMRCVCVCVSSTLMSWPWSWICSQFSVEQRLFICSWQTARWDGTDMTADMLWKITVVMHTVLHNAFWLFCSQELSLKVQEVLGLRVLTSLSEESPDSESTETDTLLTQSEARGASSCQPFNGQTPQRPPTYP